jgi:hypothetical protein
VNEPIDQISEREQFIIAWQEEANSVIQQISPSPDEIFVGFIRFWFSEGVGLYYDNLLEQQSKTREEYLAGLKSISELSYLEQTMGTALYEYLKQDPDYNTENLELQLTHFGMALNDKALEFDKSPLEDKLDMFRARRLALQNKIALKQDDARFMKTAKPTLDYINNRIADFESMIAERGDLKKESERLIFFIRDKRRFSDKTLDELAEYLSLNGIIRNKQAFIDFILAKDVQVPIHADSLLYYMEVIRLLYDKHKVLKLNKGKGFLKHTAQHIQDFSLEINRSKISQYLSNLRSKTPPNTTKMTVLGEFIQMRIK